MVSSNYMKQLGHIYCEACEMELENCQAQEIKEGGGRAHPVSDSYNKTSLLGYAQFFEIWFTWAVLDVFGRGDYGGDSVH